MADADRIGKGAPDLEGGEMNSERESAAGRTPSREANRTERDGSGPKDKDAGREPHELQATRRSDFERKIEEKEGPLAQRTPDEMRLHEELDKIESDEDED